LDFTAQFSKSVFGRNKNARRFYAVKNEVSFLTRFLLKSTPESNTFDRCEHPRTENPEL